MEQKFTAKNIEQYDLFGTKNTASIERVIQISERKICVYLKPHIFTDNLKLWRIECDPEKPYTIFLKKKLTGFSAEHRDKKIIIVGDFNPYYNYRVEINGSELPVILDPTPGGILDTRFAFDENEELGACILDDFVRFKVWSPPALCIKLLLYDTDAETLISDSYCLEKQADGLHTLDLMPSDIGRDSLENCFYQYQVYAYGNVLTASDPYAKSMAPYDPDKDEAGKSAIIRPPTERPGKPFKNSDIIKGETDVIAYEMHVRDFSIEAGFTDESVAGTYSAIGQHADFFSDLGITHLQLMPVHKCHTQKETDKRFSYDKKNIKNYNWGYDPLNFFTLEGRYAQNPYAPANRIHEFRSLTEKIHQKGIGLILDVVFNHVYSAATFENLAPGCYLRFNNRNEISVHTGAGPTMESRHFAVRKLIIDVLAYYTEVLGADGFRFDLMEFTDAETLRLIREKIGLKYDKENPNNLLLWGEAWEFKDIEYHESFTKLHRPKDLNISMFNDVMRDAALGHTTEGGFFQGRGEWIARLASAVTGGIKDFDQNDFPFPGSDFFHPYHLFSNYPAECLNYLTIHDGLALWDKINLTVKDPAGHKRLQIAKQSLTALFTSQGRLIIEGGAEMLRTKPASESELNNPRVITNELVDPDNSSTSFHDNSYQSADYTNMLRHSVFKGKSAKLAKSLQTFVKGLIQIRRQTQVFRYETNEEIHKALKFLHNQNTEKHPDCQKVHSFKSHKLNTLNLTFINGPKNDILFLTGEIHPYDDNPEKRAIPVKFDWNGKANVFFSRKDIDNFDLNKWQAYHRLNVKLVRTPGEWDIPSEYYTASGSNSLSPCDIDDNNNIHIDLSVKDFASETGHRKVSEKYLAYRILNLYPKENAPLNRMHCFFIVHNASDTELSFKNLELADYDSFKLFADSQQVYLSGLNIKSEQSIIRLQNSELQIPAHTSVILGAYKQ